MWLFSGIEKDDCPYGMATTGPSEARCFKPIAAGPKECRQPIASHLVYLIIVHPCSDATQAIGMFKIGTVSLTHVVCLVSCAVCPSGVILLLLNIKLWVS